ncbi:MAG: HEPN domain-containing protein [Deltaproteobacteria bacterium]|nr:MAG: HEPN domain-containing protein [Deltaproteobacteria bacterium]
MKPETATLIRYRLDRAFESIDEARLLLQNGHLHSAVNRLYYACFYAVSGLLLTEELSSAKHSGTMALFERHWVKTGKVPRELGILYRRLFNRRQKGDYDDLVKFLRDDIETWIGEVKTFVAAISYLIQKWEQENGPDLEVS